MIQPEYYENYDLETIVTPVNVDRFIQCLKESNYDATETEFLSYGLTNGIDIKYQGPEEQKSESDNIPFSVGNSTILWNKLMKEVKLLRVAGPFAKIPYDNYIQSPIGLVPKAGNDQTRLIFHLSYDFGEDEREKSVNFHTPKHFCMVKYRD